MGIYHRDERNFRDNLLEKTVTEVFVNKQNTNTERKYQVIILVGMCVNTSLGR